MGYAVGTMIVFLLAAGSFVISYCQFHEKGIPVNNAYLFASKEERETMNKKPYYRQSAIVFFCMGVIFSLSFIDMLFLHSSWLFCIIAIAAVVLLIYVIASSVTIAENEDEQ